MPFVVPCPKCGTQLRSATQLPAGRRLTCPVCEYSFTIRTPAVPVLISTGLNARDGDDVPDALIVDDELDDGRPPAGRPDDDDRPRPRRYRDEDRRAKSATRSKK